jgi:pimeloyl-ACP methyl ester carboxylesterase
MAFRSEVLTIELDGHVANLWLDEAEHGIAMPGGPNESFRPGVLHNAKRMEDGRWAWRYDRLRQEGDGPIDFRPLWEDVAALLAPTMLVRGGKSAFVHDEDKARLRELQPAARVELVDDAGHSVQGDRPLVLAGLIAEFLASTP